AGGSVFVLANAGDGSFTPAIEYAAGSGAGDVAAAALAGGGGASEALVTANLLADDASVLACASPVWLLRSDAVTSLAPLAPPRASLFVPAGTGGATLDLAGPDGVADAGEGRFPSAPGSGDDDRAYVA